MTRANYLPAPAAFDLSMACVVVNQAFGEHGCYLVGSSLDRRDYRDVDVRLILEDEVFDKLFGRPDANQLDARWSLICSSISLYLSQHSGLPVDFQVQRATEANATFPGQRRHPLGIFFEAPR